MSSTRPLYFDYCATTPVDPRVIDTITPYFTEKFGNSISSLHSYGWDAERAVENARRQVAEALHASPHEIFFTSGATESNNWVLQGLVSHLILTNKSKIHILSSPVEHNSIIKTLEHLKAIGQIDFDLVPVNQTGTVDPSEIEKRIRPETKLMSFMWVNNELGSINPIAEIGAIARKNQIYFHTDATQAVGKIPVDLSAAPVDLMSFSGHKIYGPKGVGALFIRGRNPKVQIHPLLYGGSHERNQRAGTVNVPAVVGMGIALQLIQDEGTAEHERLLKLKTKYFSEWNAKGLKFTINGYKNPLDSKFQAPHIMSMTLHSTQAEPTQLTGVAYSRGSACQSGEVGMSHVLSALNFDQNQANHTLRISFGRFTTDEDFLKLTKILLEKVKI